MRTALEGGEGGRVKRRRLVERKGGGGGGSVEQNVIKVVPYTQVG